MLIANAVSDNDKMLVIGLDEDELAQLADDQPIYRELGDVVEALRGWKLAILGPEDSVRFIAQISKPNDDETLA